MGCRSREYEMSLTLDGRLPSGRRAVLLRHVESCAECTQTWARLRRAQELALAVPAPRLSPGFASLLRERIASGEVAPEAVYAEPRSWLTRARHVAVGAAAAALVIVAYEKARNDTGGMVSHEVAAELPKVAPPSAAPLTTGWRGPNMALEAGGEAMPPRRATPLSMAGVRSVTEADLAVAGAKSVVSRGQDLRLRARALVDSPSNDGWAAIEPRVTQLRTALGVMHWLERNEIVTLPPSGRAELREADDALAQFLVATSASERRETLQRLLNVKFERIEQHLDIRCCRPAADLLCDLQSLVHVMPEAGDVLAVSVEGMDPFGAVFDRSGRGSILLLRVDAFGH